MPHFQRFQRRGIPILRCCWLILMALGCRGEIPSASSDPQKFDAPAMTQSEPEIPETRFELEADFAPLTLDQFESFGADADTWKASADVISCTGKPRGYLYTTRTFRDFTLRMDFRFPRPDNLKDENKFKGNTGFLVYITGEHKLWPVCLEVQGKHVQMAAIKENGGAAPVIVEENEAARQQARKPIGQWNAIEITSKAGTLQVSLNGTPISRSQTNVLNEGSVGIQAEDHPFEIRRMRIRTNSLPTE